MTGSRWQKIALAACFGLSLAVNLQSVNEDFLYGHKGWCAARRAVAGRNFVRHGFVNARFGPVENLTPNAEAKDFDHYWHHPVGIHLLVGASFTVFGVGEWQARLVPILLMLMGFLLFADLARRWWPTGPGRWAAMVFFSTTPMLAYYGPFVNQEPLVLLACLASVWTYTRWRETPTTQWVLASAAVAILGAWSDWPWFFFAFCLALLPVGVMVTKRQLDLRWLAPFCAAVLLGLGIVVWHLSELHGGDDFVKAFRDLGSFRQSGKGKTLESVLNRQVPRWLDLFTPTLVLAAFVWPIMATRDARRGQWSMKHNCAVAFFALGAGWVIIFNHGAWVHDYWPMFAAVYLVIAGADVVSAVTRMSAEAAAWRPGRQWAPAIAAATAATMILTQAVTGLAGTAQRVDIADTNPKEGEDFRHRHAVVASWIQARTDPSDVVAVHDVMLKAKFQMGFYLDRKARRFRIHETTTGFKRVGPTARMVVVDLRRAPQGSIRGMLRHATRTHPLTVLEDFLVVDLKTKVETPNVTWLRLRPDPPSWMDSWLTSTIYPPETLTRDLWLEAELLLNTGHEDEAMARREEAGQPETLRQHAAAHNIALRAGETPPEVASWLGDLGTVLDTPIDHQGKLSLLGYTLRAPHREGEVVKVVYRVDADPGRGWRPFFNRYSRPVLKPNGADAKVPMVARTLTASGHGQVGEIFVVRTYSGLNPWRNRVRYQVGFWRPGKARPKTKGKKGKAKVPNEHLEVDGERGAWIDRSDWQSRSVPPWILRRIPYVMP